MTYNDDIRTVVRVVTRSALREVKFQRQQDAEDGGPRSAPTYMAREAVKRAWWARVYEREARGHDSVQRTQRASETRSYAIQHMLDASYMVRRAQHTPR